MTRPAATTKIASDFTVADYLAMRGELDTTSPRSPTWTSLREAFRRRIEARFLVPIQHLLSVRPSKRSTPGFAILALDCLLIDTLQSFREGRVSTGDVSSSRSFVTFLKSSRFNEFSQRDRREFVHYVRNGLLHNGETRGDWRVLAGQPRMLTRDAGSRILDRTRFHAAIAGEFDDYQAELVTGPDDCRAKFLRRMDAICGVHADLDRRSNLTRSIVT